MEIRKLVATDWDQVKLIYEKGIATGNATFKLAPRHGKNGINHILLAAES